MGSGSQYLIRFIEREIPRSILEMAFQRTQYLNQLNITLHAGIKDQVITQVLLQDISITGGLESIIDISNCPTQSMQAGIIIDVGMGPTNGKEIVSVLSVGYGYTPYGLSGAANIASALSEAYTSSDARVQLIDKNVIYVMGLVSVAITNARVVYEYDSELNNISPRAWTWLGELAVLAAKMIIYNKLYLALHNAEVVNGTAMPAVMDIVERYADASKDYYERLKEWKKIALFQDSETMSRLIRMSVPGV